MINKNNNKFSYIYNMTCSTYNRNFNMMQIYDILNYLVTINECNISIFSNDQSITFNYKKPVQTTVINNKINVLIDNKLFVFELHTNIIIVNCYIDNQSIANCKFTIDDNIAKNSALSEFTKKQTSYFFRFFNIIANAIK